MSRKSIISPWLLLMNNTGTNGELIGHKKGKNRELIGNKRGI